MADKKTSSGKATKKAKQRGAGKPRPRKVCDRCFEHNDAGATVCKKCGKDKFAPEWVRELRRVTRNFSVQVNTPSPLSSSTDPIINLNKWWPGGRSSININSSEHWEAIKSIIDLELGPILGWKTNAEVKKAIADIDKSTEEAGDKIEKLLANDPDLLAKLVGGIDLTKVAEEDVPQLTSSITSVAQILTDLDAAHRTGIEKLVQQLPGQGKKALEHLSELMESLTLAQITGVTTEVQRRIGLLETFAERAVDDKTYEIIGENSIHRLLERAMWIVDERYWLMHSNRTLRTVVGKEFAKADKKFEKNRPDFVCGVLDNKLIVIELKRPSHHLTVDDLNQLERYVRICMDHESSVRTFEAILVGSKASAELKSTLKLRNSSFKVRTYAELVEDARRRYANYLTHLAETADSSG